MWRHPTPLWFAHFRIFRLVNPVPLSETLQSGLPWIRTKASISRATLALEMLASAISASLRPQHRVPRLHRRRQGLTGRAFSTILSGMTAAARRVSLVYFSSGCLSRFMSDRSIPPWPESSLQNVAGQSPCCGTVQPWPTRLMIRDHPDHQRFGETALLHLICSFTLGRRDISPRGFQAGRSARITIS